MADERCVYPGDDPRTPDRWLDLETAERLLRGESLEAVDATARDQAERLAKTLEALTSEPVRGSAALPGEGAALAAFRKVRAERADDRVGPPVKGRHRAGADSDDACLVRIGAPDPEAVRPRRRRPAHFALAAVLAAGVVGGAAVVAGTGVLQPSGQGRPDPGATVSPAVTPDRPLISPSPSVSPTVPSPGPSAGAGGSRDSAGDDTGKASGTGSDGRGARPGGGWGGAASACRDIRDGKNLDPGRKRSLEGVAGGSPRVWKYCKGVLSEGGTKTGADDRRGGGKGGEDDGGNEDNDKSGRGDRDGWGGGGNSGGGNSGRGHGNGGHGGWFKGSGGNHHGTDGGATDVVATDTPAPPAPPVPHRATMSPDPAPAPTYSAL
ncbi:hypothetical protein [Streptomyces sp. SID13726]|uniref:hypothetical protein n=1 Tax=Streptomyces sp. SID13726 TaxID=2706058 RepID=UPI0013B6B9D8|nr:hypothetical protein [Streptomyces sp. SID13726]NEA99776.1 hypothetical protein [Streptomyces sp. SID13726]